MNQTTENRGYRVRRNHFPIPMFLITFLVLLMMGGIHYGVTLWVNVMTENHVIRTTVVILYWVLVSASLTLLTRWQMKKTYEIPLQNMAEATSRVANGDFSVYVPPLHTNDRLDYLDVMMMDFNRMVEELGSIETLKTDFFSNVSHEIKTPIAVILGAAENLKREDLPEERRQEFVDTIIQSSRKLSNLMTNILKLNMLEKQNIQPLPEEFDLCEQLCGCVMQFEDVMEEKQIDFEARLEDACMIRADASLLELVWSNLLSNAFKFTEEGGNVRLTQSSSDGEVVVSVADSGCGMGPETMKNMFDKFYQGDTSHAVSGNGLGLALALRIVQMMGGTIQVESEIGVGSIFTVRMPVDGDREVDRRQD